MCSKSAPSGPERGSGFSGPQCSKSLVQSQWVSVSKTSNPADCAIDVLVDSLQSVVRADGGYPARPEHQRPPPTDLVVTLLHLLI